MCGRKLKEVRLDGRGKYLKDSTVFPLSARISTVLEEMDILGRKWRLVGGGVRGER